MSPNVKLYIFHAVTIVGILVTASAVFWEGVFQDIVLGIGILAVIIGILYGVIAVRCPHCKRQLPLRGFGCAYCPHCGDKID